MKKIVNLIIFFFSLNNIYSMQYTQEIKEKHICYVLRMPNEIILNILEFAGGIDLDSFNGNYDFEMKKFKSTALTCKKLYSLFNFIKEKINLKKKIFKEKESEYLNILNQEFISSINLNTMVNLLSYGINPNLKSNNRFEHTILTHAVWKRNLDLVKLIINRFKADINVKNRNGENALFTAIIIGSIDITRFLVNSGIKVNIKDNFNLTPLQIAKMIKNNKAQNISLNTPFLDKATYLNNIEEIINILENPRPLAFLH